MAGSIRQRKPGVWQIRVSAGFANDGTRRVLTETFEGSERQAEMRKAELVTNVNRGSVPNAVTLGSLLNEYLGRDDLARSTKAKVTANLKHLPTSWRRRRVDRITARDVQNLYRQMTVDKVPASAVRSIHETCRASVNNVVALGDLDRNPFARATPPPASRSRASAPSLDVIQKLWAEAQRNQLHAVWFQLALMTGARRAEVLAVRWSSLSGNRLTIDEALEVDGAAKDTKTHSVRVVSLDDATVAMVQAWMFAQRKTAADCQVALVADPYIISSDPTGAEPWRPSSATQLFTRIRRRAGVGDSVRLHDLRHGAASHMLANGMDVVTVAKRLGHANPHTTMKIYGHVIEGQDERAASVLASAYKVGN